MEQHLVASRKVLESHGRKLGVGNDDLRPVVGADARRAQPDILYRPDAVAKFAKIADVDRLVANDSHAAEQILNGLLRGQGDGDTADSEASENRAGVVT